jgi:hypothetical protein
LVNSTPACQVSPPTICHLISTIAGLVPPPTVGLIRIILTTLHYSFISTIAGLVPPTTIGNIRIISITPHYMFISTIAVLVPPPTIGNISIIRHITRIISPTLHHLVISTIALKELNKTLKNKENELHDLKTEKVKVTENLERVSTDFTNLIIQDNKEKKAEANKLKKGEKKEFM